MAIGTEKAVKKSTVTKSSLITEPEFISTAKEDHNIKIVTNSSYLWDSNQKEAIEKGNLIHNIMSFIKTRDDIDFVINDFIESSIINIKQSADLKKIIIEIIEHQKLMNYFNSEDTIYNERDIITKEGQILRPDRIIINPKNQVVIIDYKTGKKDKKHQQQLISYQDILEMMNFKVIKKYLVYINDTVEVEEV